MTGHGLTIHSTRYRLAARVDSGVSRHEQRHVVGLSQDSVFRVSLGVALRTMACRIASSVGSQVAHTVMYGQLGFGLGRLGLQRGLAAVSWPSRPSLSALLTVQ